MPMPVEIQETPLPDVLLIKTKRIGDDRGYFTECYSQKMWAEAGFEERFVQDNLSMSAKGTLRGLHYQIEPAEMGKLIRVITGAVYDVAVDLRQGSPYFGRYYGVELTGDNDLLLWAPPGFAHGFLALEDDTRVYYKCTNIHTPEAERSLLYACPKLNIDWPIEPTIVSDKDAQAPPLDEADYNFVYQKPSAPC